MANKKLFPYEITTIFLNNILNLDSINIIWGGVITKQFTQFINDSVLPLDTQQQIINIVTEINNNDELTTKEKNKQSQNATINIANEDTIYDIKRKYGDNMAIWLPSDSTNPSVTHEQFYFKKFKVSKGVYDEDYKAYVIPGERPNCRCGMEILEEDN